MKRGLTFLVALVCLVLTTWVATPAFAGHRVALVVGNSQYRDPRLVLQNPKNDASDVAGALKDLGFSVITATDMGLDEFEEALGRFKTQAQDAEIALFFYAGHAVQFDHVNYFIPTDAVIERPDHLKKRAVAIDEIEDALKGVQGAQVMILDACRDNPFDTITVASRGLSMSRGLERVQVSSGDSVVLFATRANEVAMDGDATRNSPFSAALVEQLKKPGKQELGSMLQQVAAKVKNRTSGQQAPELTISISGEYYFDLDNDRLEWDGLKASLDPKALREFARHFPDSPFRREAERRATLYEQQAAQRAKDDADRAAKEADRVAKEAERKRKEQEAQMQAVCSISRQLLDILTTGRDEAGLEHLEKQNACPTLKDPIEQALRSVGSLTRQARCDRLNDDIHRWSSAGDDVELGALTQDAGACPGSSQKIAKAIDDIRGARERDRLAALRQKACDTDEASLDALRNGQGADRIGKITQLGTASSCDRVRDEATALAESLRAAEAKVAEAAACAAESKTLDGLAAQGPRSAIEALGRTHQCPSLDVRQTLARFDAMVEAQRIQAACVSENHSLDMLATQGPRSAIEGLGRAHQCPTLDVGQAMARFDDMVAKRQQQALAACAAVDITPLREGGDSKGLSDLSARCPSRDGDVRAALAVIDGKRRVAEACRKEQTELQGYVAAGQPPAVAALQKRAVCPTLDFDAANQQIAKAACDADVSGVVHASGADEAGMRRLAEDSRLCPDARTLASRRIDALVLARQTDDRDCDAAIADAVKQNDSTHLQRLSGEARCDRRHDMIATRIDTLRTAERIRLAEVKCAADDAALAKLGNADEGALRGMAGNAQICDRVRTVASARLATLVAARDKDDRDCDAAVNAAATRRDIDGLQHLRADPLCVRRQSTVAVRLATLVADEQARIVLAQRKLIQVGCLSGPANGAIDNATRTAISSYWAVRHADQPAPTTISLDVSTELEGQSGAVCAIPPRLPEAVMPTPQASAPPPPARAKPEVATAEPETPDIGLRRPRVHIERKPPVEETPAPRRKLLERPHVEPFRPAERPPVREPRPAVARRPIAPAPAPMRAAPPVTAEPSAPKPHVFFN